MEEYLPLVVMLGLAVAFVLLSLGITRLLAPYRPTGAKGAPYESGIVPARRPPERFPVKFYLVAMIFIVFDIEIIFLYPWAVQYRELGGSGLVEVLLFAVAVFVSFLYMLANGALDWGPATRLRRQSRATDAGRTSESTVRRVGLDGRAAAATSGTYPDPRTKGIV